MDKTCLSQLHLLSQVCPSPFLDPIKTQSLQATNPSFIICFPQMKPEAKELTVEGLLVPLE